MTNYERAPSRLAPRLLSCLSIIPSGFFSWGVIHDKFMKWPLVAWRCFCSIVSYSASSVTTSERAPSRSAFCFVFRDSAQTFLLYFTLAGPPSFRRRSNSSHTPSATPSHRAPFLQHVALYSPLFVVNDGVVVLWSVISQREMR